MGRIGITVKLEWSAKRYSAVSRANSEDVARVGADAMGCIDEVNYPVLGGRLSPPLVPPVSRAIGYMVAK